MLRIALIDDNSVHREFFSSQLEKILKDEQYELTTFASPKEFMKAYKKKMDELDLLILDIQYPEDNGIDFAGTFHEEYPHVDIVFMSSYLEYAPKVYDVDHVSFVYKGDMGHNLQEAVRKALKHKEEKEKKYLRLRWKNTYYMIPISEIMYIEKVLRKTNVYTKNRVYTSYIKMDDIIDELDDSFLRVHFSYVANKKFIHEFHSDSLVMTDGKFIPVSRTYSKAVMDYVHSQFSSDEGKNSKEESSDEVK